MTIVIPADVLPLLYSGLQLDLWQRVLPELTELLERPGRAEHPERFTQAFARLDRQRALLEEIDWPRTRPPAATEIAKEHHAALLAGLYAERDAQRYLAQDARGTKRDLELRERSARAVEAIELFLAVLVQDDAQAPVERGTAGRFTDPHGIERAIVLQLLRDDHHTRWTRRELERELNDVAPQAIDDALKRLQTRGAVHLEHRQIRAARGINYLSTLGMVGI
jgi:hypothetical protein